MRTGRDRGRVFADSGFPSVPSDNRNPISRNRDTRSVHGDHRRGRG